MIHDSVVNQGIEETAKIYGISVESVRRYEREYRRLNGTHSLPQAMPFKPIDTVDIACDGSITIGIITDTHYGSIHFSEPHWDMIADTLNQRCDIVCHAGDVTDGLSQREHHIYELVYIGYEEQRDYAVEQLSKITKPLLVIDGNHDRWYIKRSGANIVRDVCDRVPGARYLGMDEGKFTINGDVVVLLWHGEDGSSTATSARLHRLIEAVSYSEPIDLIITGHTHKAMYFYEKGVHVISGGAICFQSQFMRRRMLANHAGYWIVTLTISEGTITRVAPEFIPLERATC